MKQDFISVIMPAYNASKHLREAIESILNQSYRYFELIIINDGSTDNTEEIIKSYNDDRILYLKNEENLGICLTLNRGLEIAKGEYIARMDSDDIALSQRFEKQIEYLKSHPDIGVLGSDVIIFGEGINESRFTLSHNKWQCKIDLLFNSCTAHPSVMMRNEILQKHNIRYNDEYRGLEDYELWWRLSKITHITNYNKPLLKYRIHSQQVTKNHKIETLLTSFLLQRLNNLNIQASENELKTFEKCNTNLYQLSNEELIILTNLFIKIINSNYTTSKIENTKLKNSLSSFLLKRIDNHNVKNKTAKKLLQSGLMSLNYYIKLKFHHIIKQ